MSSRSPVPTPVLRVDAGEELGQVRETPQGFVRFDSAPVARPGIYEYADPKYPGGVRRELRPEEEVFSPQSLASYDGAPITSGHPRAEVVDRTNVRLLKVGTVMGSARRSDGLVRAPIQVEDASAISDIRSRKRQQLSPGYRIDFDDTPGVHPKWGPYHGTQRNIRVNHLALVGSARGGDALHVRLDGVDADICVGRRCDSNDAATRRGVTMDQEEQIRSLKAQLDEQTKLAQTRLDEAKDANHRADAAEARVAPLEERIGELERHIAEGAAQIETEALQRERRRADEAEEAVRRFDERLGSGIRERSNLMHRAVLVLGTDFRMDDLNNRQIQEAVIRRLDRSANLKDMTDGHVEGRFEAMMELHAKTARSLRRLSDTVSAPDTRFDGREMSSGSGRDRQDPAAEKAARLKDFRDRWKKPLPNDIRAQRGERT